MLIFQEDYTEIRYELKYNKRFRVEGLEEITFYCSDIYKEPLVYDMQRETKTILRATFFTKEFKSYFVVTVQNLKGSELYNVLLRESRHALRDCYYETTCSSFDRCLSFLGRLHEVKPSRTDLELFFDYPVLESLSEDAYKSKLSCFKQ